MATPPTSTPAQASSWAVDYAREERPFGPENPGDVKIHLLTDPWSIWCWGFEPIRRTLELRYPTIEFAPLLGGMFEELPSREERGFDLDAFFTMVQRTTGMPITTEGLRNDRPASTFPACVHVHAVRLLDPEQEEAYLRALREAAYLDGLNISSPDVGAQVAGRVGLDPGAFREAMASGEPEREFRDRLSWLHQMDLYSYPTYLISNGERTARVEGFQNIASLVNVVESLSGRVHPTRPVPSLDEVLGEGQRVATREVAEVRSTSLERAFETLVEAEADGRVIRERHPTGDVWSLA